MTTRDLLAEGVRLMDRATLPLRRMIRRGVVKAVTDTFFVQVEQFEDELHADVDLWQGYGFASRPPAESEVLVVHPYGEAEGAVAIASNNRDHRPTLNEGDAALHSEVSSGEQAAVFARQDGSVDLECATGEFVNVGGDAEKLLLGESYTAKLAALNTAVAALSAASDLPTVITLANGLKTALTTYSASATALLAAKGKVT